MKPKHGGQRPGAGRPPSADPTQIKSVRLTGSDITRIKTACAHTGMSMSEFIRRAILAALEKIELNKKGK